MSGRKTERSGPKIGCSGAERGAGVTENDGAGAERGVLRSGNGVGSGLNRPLTAQLFTLLTS